MRPKRGEQSAFSLFPFLAVLLCAMGALVVLLVAIAEVTRKQATAEADEARVAAQAEADGQSESAESLGAAQERLERLRQIERRLADLKAEGERRLKEEQEKLSGVEDHVRRLREEAEALQAEAQELFKVEQQAGADLKAAREELERLNRLINESVDELDQYKHAAAGRERRFAVVPLRDKTSGTVRPPVYFECTAEGVVLQPEGVRLVWEDLIAPQFSNPVGAAERAVARYYSENPDARAANEAGRPYPLLIVRPDGINAYYMTRAALEEAGVDYGYQPVGADWPMEYGDPNPVLYRWVTDAVATAQSERTALSRITPQLATAMRAADQLGRGDSREIGGYGGSGDSAGGGAPGLRVSRADPNASNPFSGLRVSGAQTVGAVLGGGDPAGGLPPDAAVGPGGPDPEGGPLPGGVATYAAAEGAAGPAPTGEETGAAEGSDNALGGGANDSPDPGQVVAAGSPSLAAPSDATAVGSAAPSDAATAGPAGGGDNQSPGGSGGSAMSASAAQQSEGSAPASVSAVMGSGPAAQEGGGGGGASTRRAGRSGVPVVRPIQLLVESERVVLLSDETNRPVKVVAMPGPTPAHLNDLLESLEQHAESWGIAGPGMYWDPRLSIRSGRDGAARAAELVELLQAAGLNARNANARAAVNLGGPDATRR
ncbi:hypothetical protein [Botrimarina sp.]|uniref:hypothetical protein n=1 Tax=Botrimarina sp. TaxID=2795802 RepID=UPI0032EBC195